MPLRHFLRRFKTRNCTTGAFEKYVNVSPVRCECHGKKWPDPGHADL